MKNVFKAGNVPDRSENRRDTDITQQLDFNDSPEWQELAQSQNTHTAAPVSFGAQDEAGFFDPFAASEPLAFQPDNQATYELGFEDISAESAVPERPAPRKTGNKKPKSVLQKLISKIKRWLRASTLNKVIAIAAAVVVVATIVLVVWLVAGTGKDKDPTGGSVDNDEVQDAISDNYTFVDESEYEGTLLTTTKDAGKEYLKETLFIGDSNFARMVMYGLLTYDNVIGVESMGIQGVTGSPSVYFSGYNEPVTIVKAVSLMKPRRIVICFGTNNILSGDPESFTKAYGSALDALHKAYTYSDIIICAIPPLGENRSNKSLLQSDVDAYNLALIDLAKEKGYTFLDTSEVLKGANGYMKPDYIYTDGIHISEKGFDMFFKYVRTHAHIVEDTRPMPIGSIPKQVAPPKKEVEPDAVFEPDQVISAAVGKFVAGGCKALTATKPTTTPTTWSFTVPHDAEPGTEGNWANGLYTAYLAQQGTPLTGSTVAIACTTSETEFLFTVTIYPVPTCATHTWKDTGKTTAATCAKMGTKEQKCEVCGLVENVDDATKPKLTTHTWGEYKETTAATCAAAGIQTRSCTVCNVVDTVTKPGNPKTTQHKFTAWKVTTAPTCVAAGVETELCSVCGATGTVTRVVAATGIHTYGAWVTETPATCTVAGLQKHTCTVCNHLDTVTNTLQPLGHTFVDGNPTCTRCSEPNPNYIPPPP